jgi:ABC-2 type transport system permease protein
MSSAQLMLRQVAYENKAFWRNPASAFFTFAFPLMFLVIFNLAFGAQVIRRPEGTTNLATLFIVPAITAFSVITACYTNIAIRVAFSRDEGILKRIRGTPLPAWAFLVGRIFHACLVALLLVVIVLVFGVTFYDVSVPTTKLPAFIVTLIVGAATFSSLGLAITTVIPNADASPAIVNASILPLLFISDIFLNIDADWVVTVSNIFPVRHFSEALQAVFNPFKAGAGFSAEHLLIMTAWFVVGLVVSIRFFTWEPRR